MGSLNVLDKNDDTKSTPFYRMVDLIVFMFIAAFPIMGFSQFRSEFMAETMALMIFGISIDLIWGYAGILSLGHAVMFGIGAYIISIHSNIQNGLPSFMQNNGLSHIPTLLLPLKSTIVSIVVSLSLPLLFGLIVGWFLFKGKVNKVFFTIVTLIMATMFTDIVLNQINYTNGFNGLQNVTFIFPKMGFLGQYYITFLILLLAYLFVLKLIHSKFGVLLRAIKCDESRVLFLGYNTIAYKIMAFSISSLLAGLSGLMFAQIHGAITVDNVGNAASVFAVVCVAFGGRGYITGALVGTLLLQWANNLLSDNFGGIWPAILGAILLLVVFFMPVGIIGKIQEIIYHNKVSKEKVELNE